jgi:hypothetical protein
VLSPLASFGKRTLDEVYGGMMKSNILVIVFVLMITGLGFAQYTDQTRLVSATDVNKIPGQGESEILVKCTPELSAVMSGKSESFSYAVYVNGTLVAQVVPNRQEKIIVKNASNALEVVLFVYDRRNGWKQYNTNQRNRATISCNANTSTIQMVISENVIGDCQGECSHQQVRLYFSSKSLFSIFC